MKVVIIYGNHTGGSTEHCVSIVKNVLASFGECSFTEFFLPTDLPVICRGCFRCFEDGEETCPDARLVQPIVSAMREADGLIFASPVYACEVSGAMKTLFDHLCYIWMTHRPMEEMFSKVGMVISVTAGAGTVTSIRTMEKNFRYCGVKRTIGFGAAVQAMSWNEVASAKKTKLEAKLTRKASRFYRMMELRYTLRPMIFQRIMFKLLGKMIQGYEPGSRLSRDQNYWRDKGWFNGKSPFMRGARE